MSPISRRCLHAVKAILLLSVVVAGQQQDPYGDYPDYNDYAGDYGQDNLYSDYAAHKDGGGYVASVVCSFLKESLNLASWFQPCSRYDIHVVCCFFCVQH